MYGPLVQLIKTSDRIPTRFNVSIMLFMACLISYMLRVNMSVNILAMVQPIQGNAKQPTPVSNTSDSLNNRTTLLASTVPNYGPRYNWTSHDQSIILGAYFYGYLVSSLPAGVFAERFGGRNMVGLSLAFSSLLTAFTPLAAEYGMWATIVNRVVLGVLAHIIPGLFLVGLIYIGFDPYVCVAIITLSLGFNGASTMTNLQNSQDLAPNFAGTLYGIINFVGTSSGFISPILVANFTVERSTMDEWQYVFMIGAAAYILPALIFIVFGSGQVQSWNERKQNTPSNERDHS
uniref:Major facilitator superfamily (MFS) profile domain-containing protein n=1 Tax=Anopheles atroparvus TaxID=41427 RepID=A0A182IPE5_ANOAO